MQTPASSRHARALSPPLSSSPTFTVGQQQKLNVVTRLAIEGKAKQGGEGAGIKMYLKISLPLENVIPGSTIPLFPEENIKILTSQVHPIDHNSVPYNFSSTTCPMLHNAARALNLPARSSQSYLSLFGFSTSSSTIGSSRHSSSPNGSNGSANPPPLEDKYTGHVLVSGYNVSFVLPKEFPPRSRIPGLSADHETTPVSFKRRLSVGDRGVVQFIAAVDMWVPYVSRPPRAPYLLSIPTPRCLSNNVKLRIFPPKTTSASLASLSSVEEEGTSWDLTSDPHVTRTASVRLSRSNSYTHFADDESSDSSTTAGFSDGCGIQGTFPSAERIRVRWAAPMKTVNLPSSGDGRRRVGVKEVKGDMTCVVLGKGKDKTRGSEGVLMNVEYKGTCKGVWFPGVATLLGMDIGLEAKGSDVTWASGMEPKWTIGGGIGYTGFDIGVPPSLSRQSSFDSPGLPAYQPPSQLKPGDRHDSTASTSSSTSSLLRAPLPAQNIAEYSFEGSATSSAPSGMLSSMGSVISPNGTKSAISSINGVDDHPSHQERPPAVPITVHVNMNELLPPSKNVFTFSISGTILLTPRSRSYNMNSQTSSPVHSDTEMDPEPSVLPRFSVLAADSETVSFIIRSEVESATVEVYNSSGDIRDAQTRKTVLQKGGFTRCGADGGRIALRTFRSWRDVFKEEHAENGLLRPGRPRTPNGLSRVSSSSSLRQQAHRTTHTRPRRDGPLMIPYVTATVTPLFNGDVLTPNSYGIRISLPAPSDADSEWLEFGLAQPSPSSSTVNLMAEYEDTRPPRVEIASASVQGVPVRFETTAAAKQEQNGLAGLGVPFEEMSGKEWVSWVRVHIGDVGGGNVQVDYLVRDVDADVDEEKRKRQKGKGKDDGKLHVFLPTFALPVGRLEVNIEPILGLEISSLRTNLKHQQALPNRRRLLHYQMEELFYPRLSLTIQPSVSSLDYRDRGLFPQLLQLIKWISPIVISFIVLSCLLSLGTELRHIKRSLESCSTVIGSGWDDTELSNTVTVTSTILTSGHSQWWFAEKATSLTAPITSDSSTVIMPSKVASTPKPTSSIPSQETQSLLPIDRFPFPWPLRFDLPPFRVTLDKLLQGLNTVWQVFRTVYHYPLDPP